VAAPPTLAANALPVAAATVVVTADRVAAVAGVAANEVLRVQVTGVLPTEVKAIAETAAETGLEKSRTRAKNHAGNFTGEPHGSPFPFSYAYS